MVNDSRADKSPLLSGFRADLTALAAIRLNSRYVSPACLQYVILVVV